MAKNTSSESLRIGTNLSEVLVERAATVNEMVEELKRKYVRVNGKSRGSK